LAYLNVLAHNTRAIRSYEKTGFVEAGRTPLMRLDTDDGYRLVPASPDSDETHAAALLRMELSRDAFCAELARLSAKAD
jgi:ribosomal protein S18 acetylase RimI-like enzyme